MHVLLLLAYIPCFDPASSADKTRTMTFGFLTKPLMMVIPATLVWSANQLCVELISMNIDSRSPLDSSFLFMFGLVECGAFVAATSWMIRKNEHGIRR